MSSPRGDETRALEVYPPHASSIFVQRIPTPCVERFLEWQRGITAAAQTFPGYQSTDIYSPADCNRDDWVVVVHFNDSQLLRAWLASPVRSAWLARLPHDIRDYRWKTLPQGSGAWFAGLVGEGSFPPHWKMFLTVLFGLYPIVMLLTIFVSPYANRFGLAIAMLIGNALSVSILEWFGMPVLNFLLGPWLRAKGKEGRALSIGGGLLIVMAMVMLAALFRLVTG